MNWIVEYDDGGHKTARYHAPSIPIVLDKFKGEGHDPIKITSITQHEGPRLGAVGLAVHPYIVDLDDEEMVQHAQDALMTDLENWAKAGSLGDCVDFVPLPKGSSESDIPDFLKENDEFRKEDL